MLSGLSISLFFIYSSVFAIQSNSQTIFKPKSINLDAVMHNAMTTHLINEQIPYERNFPSNNELELNKSENKFSIISNFFYEESTNSSDLARYFFPNNKTELVIKGQGAVYNRVDDNNNKISETPDIFAEWLQIASDSYTEEPYPAPENDYKFSSKIKLNPEFKRFGWTLKLHKQLSDQIWIEGNFPFIQVETNAKLEEYDKQNERTPDKIEKDFLNTIHNAIEAFNNPLMKYGKITNQLQKLAGLSDINFKIGYSFKSDFDHTLNVYSSLIFPTSYKPICEYMFEPIIGNSGHFGLGAGINLDFQISSNINFFNMIDYKYLFKNNEKRSFDLTSNGQWSRYLAATNKIINDRPIPLINFLTKEFDITPGSVANFLSSIHYINKSFHLEFGYNFYFQQKEKIKLKYEWEEDIGIALWTSNNLATFDTEKNSNPKASINSIMVLEYDTDIYIPISKKNFNLSSASHPSKISNQFYTSLGMEYDNTTISIGGSYQVSSGNTSLSSYKLWLQIHTDI